MKKLSHGINLLESVKSLALRELSEQLIIVVSRV